LARKIRLAAGEANAMALQLFVVEFVGGPFDGLVRDVVMSPESLPPFAAMPLSVAAPSAWGVAYYELYEELHDADRVWRYRFLAVVRNTPRGPAGWIRKTIVRMRRWAMELQDKSGATK